MHEEVEICFLDIGQGDATLIHTHMSTHALLIDTGGSYQKTINEKIAKEIQNECQHRGIRTLDVVITHKDIDHYKAFEILETLNTLHIKHIFTTPYSTFSTKSKILQIPCFEGDRITYGRLVFYVLHPPRHLEKVLEKGSKNNTSLVLYLQLQKQRFLFTGDLENETYLYTKAQDTTYLKVAHHGSKTSTSTNFLQHHKNIQLAFISSGRRNRYQHPHEEVIQRLKKENIIILNTKEHGMIEYRYKL